MTTSGPRSQSAKYGPPIRKQPDGCHLWIRAKDKDGYGYFKRDGKVILAHKHYYEVRHGAVPVGCELDHKCRNRACVNPEHLEPVSHLENVRRGRVAKVMTMEKARQVRALRATGTKLRDIAEQVGIGESLVAQIVTNRCWREDEKGTSSINLILASRLHGDRGEM